MIFVATNSGPKSSAPTKLVSRRTGNCTSKRSIVRPVAASFPTFLTHPESGPQGFEGFAVRRGKTKF